MFGCVWPRELLLMLANDRGLEEAFFNTSCLGEARRRLSVRVTTRDSRVGRTQRIGTERAPRRCTTRWEP